MAADENSLQHRLRTNEVDLIKVCRQFEIDDQTLPQPPQGNPYAHLVTILSRQNRLPELYAYLEKQYPHVTWRAQQREISIQAGRTVEIEGDVVGGDKIGGDKITYHGLSVEEVATLVVQLKNEDQPTVWDGRIPYLGLNAFQESDAEFFFGREALVDELLERVQQANFITVSGPSGSGKSSIVRAGLFHALRHGRIDKSDQWLLATMNPQGNPQEQLAHALGRATKSPAARDAVRQNLDNFADMIDLYLSDDRRQRFVLFVDQFEETFTQTKEPQKRAAFIDLLTSVVERENGRVIVILSLRSDFISNCTVYPTLRQKMSRQLQLVGAMSPQELAQAITLPSLTVGAEIDPALVSRIITDMKGEPGSLPLMSFALRDLFEVEKSVVGEPMDMTLPEYLQRGGLESALDRHAQQVFETFTAEQKGLAKDIFSKLIEVGQGRADTRRTADFDELIPADLNADETEQVVNALAGKGARLLTTSGQSDDRTVTIAHERLIDAWPWLRQLVDENRERIALQNQIMHDAQMWAAEKDDGFLYRGGRLLQIEERLDELMPHLSSLSVEFIQAGIQLRRAEEQRREEQRRRELAQQQALAAEQAKRAEEAEEASQQLRRRRNLAFGLAGIAVVLAVVAFILFGSAQENAVEAQENADIAQAEATRAVAAQQTAEASEATANRQRTIADAQAMLALSSVLIADGASPSITETERSLLMAVQAIRIDDALEANIDFSLRDSQLRYMLGRDYRPPWTAQLQGHTDYIHAVAFSPDGQTLASAGADETVRLWNPNDLRTAPTILSGHTGKVFSVAFSPDGQTLASAGEDKNVRLWNLAEPEAEPIILTGHTASIFSVTFSPDGQTLASAGDDETIRLWNLDDPEAEPAVLRSGAGWVWTVAFAPDGRTLASGGDDQVVRLWAMDDPAADPAVLTGHTGQVMSVAFAPDGRTLASAGDDQTVRLWNLEDPDMDPTALTGHTAVVSSVAFAPDGQTLASVGEDQAVHLWHLDQLEAAPAVLTGHTDWIFSVAFAPDGQTLASAGEDRTVRLWNLSPPPAAPTTLSDSTDWVWSAAFSADAQMLAAAGDDQLVRIWTLDEPEVAPAVLSGHTDPINTVAFAPDGQILASAGEDETIRLWSPHDPQAAPTILQGHAGPVLSVAFAPDGQTLASAGKDQTVRLWNLDDPQADPTILVEHTAPVNDVVFAPDGRTLASAGEDETVRLWSVNDPQAALTILSGHVGQVLSVTFAPDGRTLASTGEDRTVRLWNPNDPQAAPIILRGHADWVWSAAFAPDGQTLASGGEDQTVRLWDVDNPQAESIVLPGHTDWVFSVAFAPDGGTVASTGADQTVRLWPTFDRLVVDACEYAGRNMGWDEWHTYLPTLPYERTCPQYPPHPTVPEEERP